MLIWFEPHATNQRPIDSQTFRRFRRSLTVQEMVVSCTVAAALHADLGMGQLRLWPHVAVGERAGPLGELFKPWLLLSPGLSAGLNFGPLLSRLRAGARRLMPQTTPSMVLILQHAVYAKAPLL